MTYKLLFVCLGNICRSPSAENIMRYLIERNNLSDQIICDSAGTCSDHVGEPPDQRMNSAAMEKLNMSLQGCSRQFHSLDFENFDLILAMDKENYDDILSLDTTGQYHHKVRLMCEFTSKFTVEEVPDPYYGGSEGFNLVIDLLIDASAGLLKHIIEQQVLSSFEMVHSFTSS
ncbi:low molecular weight protein-tyrosine-phosphatase [Dendronalium sp. ChiSLP03b]|uniref:low molecular weight protein-tyrosine-phosphatase n=1 Tax=Dendronalium sp. ChiSLP03b TaxID=3075381 RepID=UPI002AD20EE0|nr:low molecular weight protein-tyrosine-phosphatase [Dendronalium sp. ChiSLP03b]MDZ8203813.1 low molecular weight protein-tyrosine-phosphatase [Dendronalium sp. ChiSLP03b]